MPNTVLLLGILQGDHLPLTDHIYVENTTSEFDLIFKSFRREMYKSE